MTVTTPRPIRRRVRKALAISGGVLVLLALAGILLLELSPRPSVWVIRAIPGSDALDTEEQLASYVPANVTEIIDEVYAPGDPDGRLDVYFPTGTAQPLPTIVWMHGGGFIGGNKEGMRDYLKIVASYGYTIVNVEYSKGPEKHYPTPILQLSEAITYAVANADRFHIDTTQFVLGGDSAGAQMSGQMAALISNPDYAAETGLPHPVDASQLRGVILFSGAFNMESIDISWSLEGWFFRTVLWAYSGTKDFQQDPVFRLGSVTPNVTSAYPPAFISTGPYDPLLEQSEELVTTLTNLNASVDSLLFTKDSTDSSVGHEYQLQLDQPEAREALVRMVSFIQTHVSTPTPLPGISAGW
jgi:acetyl esterase/lipase